MPKRSSSKANANEEDNHLNNEQSPKKQKTTQTKNTHSHLLPLDWNKRQIEEWLHEDIPSFDYGGFVVGEDETEATLWCKRIGTSVLSGSPFVEAIFHHLGCEIKWNVDEGEEIVVTKENPRVAIAKVTGPVRKILVGERTALNLMSRASGIATLSREASNLAKKHNFKGVVAGTRKTTPGFRAVEKLAILVGGCDMHRMDLSSMTMLKDNHVWSTGSITKAVAKARTVVGFSMKIEVECQNQSDAEEALQAGADVVMLDNMLPAQLHSVAKSIKSKFPNAKIEASGGVTLSSLPEYFSDFIDVISMGSLTQSVPHIDFSLKVKKTN